MIDLPKKRYECLSCRDFISSPNELTSCPSCKQHKLVLLSVEHESESFEKAEASFKNKELLKLILEELSKDHLGDDNLKMTLFLVCVSSFLENPRCRQSMGLFADASEGKDNLIKTIFKHLPTTSYTFLTSATESALQDDLKDFPIIAISEFNLFKDFGANKYLLEILKQRTEGGTCVAKKDLRNKNKTLRLEEAKQGTVIFGTTDTERDAELDSRCLAGSIKSTTQAIRTVSHDTMDYFASPERMIHELKNYDSWLKVGLTEIFNSDCRLVYFPFLNFLKEKINGQEIFDYNSPRAKRDVKKLLSLASAMTLLFHKQRERRDVDGKSFLVGEPQDLVAVLHYAQMFFDQTYSGVDSRLNEILELVNSPTNWVDRRKLEEKLSVTKNTIKGYCKTLSAEGLIEGRRGSDLKGGVIGSFDSNRVYYRRCQKGVKKKFLRCRLEELRKFLEEKTKITIDTPDNVSSLDDKEEIEEKKGCQNEGVKTPVRGVATSENTEDMDEIDTLNLTPCSCGRPSCFYDGTNWLCNGCANEFQNSQNTSKADSPKVIDYEGEW